MLISSFPPQAYSILIPNEAEWGPSISSHTDRGNQHMGIRYEVQKMPIGWSIIMGKALNNDDISGPHHSQVKRDDDDNDRKYDRVSKRQGRRTEGVWRPGKRYLRILKRGRSTEGIWHPQVRAWWGIDCVRLVFFWVLTQIFQ